MMISHQLVIYVIPMKMVKCYQLQLCKNFTTSDGIQHLIDENEYQYDDDEWTSPLSDSNWIFKTNKHFMKYLNFTLQEMTPEQLMQNPITVHPNPKVDTEEGESNTDEQESTISNKEEEESSTFFRHVKT